MTTEFECPACFRPVQKAGEWCEQCSDYHHDQSIDNRTMETLIDKLRNLHVPTARQERALANLIGRIEYFERVEDLQKLEECRGEAENWLAHN